MYEWVRPVLYAGRLFAGTLLLCIPLQALSAQASLLLHPTLISFEGTQRTQSVNLTNHGDATGVFEISWVDFSMTPEGGLIKWDTLPPWSLQSYVRYSPRRVTLRPGETQIVKIALRRTQAVSDGEYISHLKFMTIHESADTKSDADNEPALDQASSVMIKAHAGMTIPIVWRNTSAIPKATIDSAHINLKKREITVSVQRLGTLSIRGYLHAVHRSADGAESIIAGPFPLVIYQNLEGRTISIPLNPDTTLAPGATGSIEVSYSKNIQTPGSSMASYYIDF